MDVFANERFSVSILTRQFFTTIFRPVFSFHFSRTWQQYEKVNTTNKYEQNVIFSASRQTVFGSNNKKFHFEKLSEPPKRCSHATKKCEAAGVRQQRQLRFVIAVNNFRWSSLEHSSLTISLNSLVEQIKKKQRFTFKSLAFIDLLGPCRPNGWLMHAVWIECGPIEICIYLYVSQKQKTKKKTDNQNERNKDEEIFLF